MTKTQAVHTPTRVQVQIPQAISALDYAIPAHMPTWQHARLQVGQLVEVPLGRQQKIGMITQLDPKSDLPTGKLKPIHQILEHIPAIPVTHWAYIRWLAEYYMADIGSALRLAIPPRPEQLRPPKPQYAYQRGIAQQTLPPAQQRLWNTLSHRPQDKAALLRNAQVSAAVFRQLLAKGGIESVIKPQTTASATIQPKLPTLNDDQNRAYYVLQPQIAQKSHAVALLHGATGSGKTEVYFHWLAEAVQHRQQVLVLLPELSLLSDWQKRFCQRFGYTPPAWHNGISSTQKRHLWQCWMRGNIPVLVGARSALHLPCATLGLIIVDEEHDLSYKQEDRIAYHARDMAVMRGKIQNAIVILASATPSLESLHNVERGHYQHLKLPSRYAQASLPEIHLIDLNKDRPTAGGWLSPTLITALSENLKRQQQSLLFLNRRGFAPLMICRHCGHRFSCDHCSSYLCLHHQPKPHLQCHHCDTIYPIVHVCPTCGLTDHLSAAGPGVERIHNEVQQHFPQARCFIATANTLHQQQAIQQFLANMQADNIDIIIGTQIIAKGFDFAKLTLAAVIDTDQALWGGNPRAAEQTWQLLQQIMGRAGRHSLPGTALLQSHHPKDALLQHIANNDSIAFIEQQKKLRKRLNFPPYGRFLAIIVKSKQADLASTVAEQLARQHPSHHRGENPQIRHRLLGPIVAPLAKLRGWYRYRLLLVADRSTLLQPVAYQMHKRVIASDRFSAAQWRAVRIDFDVDPFQFH